MKHTILNVSAVRWKGHKSIPVYRGAAPNQRPYFGPKIEDVFRYPIYGVSKNVREFWAEK